jgi:transcriptional regulator with XRE-family HTH domain
MPVRTRVLDHARHRGRLVRTEIGGSIRHARLAAGLRLCDVAEAIGRSVAWVSRVERGMFAKVSMEELVVLCAAVGLKLWLTTYAAERAIHDAPQLALLRRFRARVGEMWQWSYEVIVPVAGDQRAADAVIRAPSVSIMIEAFTRIADGQAQLRAVRLKARDMEIERIIIVVGATPSNRRAMAAAADVVASDFPLGTKAVIRALSEGRDPGANGIVTL